MRLKLAQTWSETSGPMDFVTGTIMSTGSTAIGDDNWWMCWETLPYPRVKTGPGEFPAENESLGSGMARVVPPQRNAVTLSPASIVSQLTALILSSM